MKYSNQCGGRNVNCEIFLNAKYHSAFSIPTFRIFRIFYQ